MSYWCVFSASVSLSFSPFHIPIPIASGTRIHHHLMRKRLLIRPTLQWEVLQVDCREWPLGESAACSDWRMDICFDILACASCRGLASAFTCPKRDPNETQRRRHVCCKRICAIFVFLLFHFPHTSFEMKTPSENILKMNPIEVHTHTRSHMYFGNSVYFPSSIRFFIHRPETRSMQNRKSIIIIIKVLFCAASRSASGPTYGE